MVADAQRRASSPIGAERLVTNTRIDDGGLHPRDVPRHYSEPQTLDRLLTALRDLRETQEYPGSTPVLIALVPTDGKPRVTDTFLMSIVQLPRQGTMALAFAVRAEDDFLTADAYEEGQRSVKLRTHDVNYWQREWAAVTDYALRFVADNARLRGYLQDLIARKMPLPATWPDEFDVAPTVPERKG
jgi:hypothetical protein